MWWSNGLTRRARRRGRTGRARGGPPSPCRPRCPGPGRAGRWWSPRPAVCPCSGWPGVSEPHCRSDFRSSSSSAVAGEVELDVEGQAGVPGGEHEAVAARPVRVGRVVPHDALNSRYAAGARLIAVPGWPLPDFSTASMASTRTVSTARRSRSDQSVEMLGSVGSHDRLCSSAAWCGTLTELTLSQRDPKRCARGSRMRPVRCERTSRARRRVGVTRRTGAGSAGAAQTAARSAVRAVPPVPLAGRGPSEHRRCADAGRWHP